MHPKLQHALDSREIQPPSLELEEWLSPEVMSLLPDPELRPLLLATIIHQLNLFQRQDEATSIPEKINYETALSRSEVFRLLQKPYQPTFIADIVQRFQSVEGEEGNLDTIYKRFIEEDKIGINSTLKNLILAHMLNQTVLRGTDLKAEVELAQYTWDSLADKVYGGHKPDLPAGTEKKDYIKFLIAIRDKAGEVIEHIDYGQNEGSKRYDIEPSGEGAGRVVGRPMGEKSIDPADLSQVIYGLEQVEASQSKEADRQAVERLGGYLHLKKKLVDFMETEEGRNFPRVIAGVEDLNEVQIDSVIQWAMLEQEMAQTELKILNNQQMDVRHAGMNFSDFKGVKAQVIFDQPSTRTTTATDLALESLGMIGKSMSDDKSSKAKGESGPSETTTLVAHGIEAVLWRGSGFERETQRRKEEVGEENMPVMVSLGGNEHHPTQTLGEVMLFMREYGCSSLEELREKTKENPPTIVFMGHTSVKRADKSLIAFILKHLPSWKIKNIVPKQEDKSRNSSILRKLPRKMTNIFPKRAGKSYLPPEFQGQANYTAIESEDLLNPETVESLTEGCQFVYISNQEGTSGAGGKGHGKKEVDYRLPTSVVEKNNLKVMAPLPASKEVEDDIFSHPNSLIPRQMQNKINIIASLLAHGLSAKKTSGEQGINE